MSCKKIGEYLIDRGVCDAQDVNTAIDLQLTLTEKGTYKPIGQILIEKSSLNARNLKLNLHSQVKDMLSSVDLFNSMPRKVISKIASTAECIAFPKGETIIYEGDLGDSFYQVISGLIRIFHVSEDGVQITLNTLGPGESFGEMALLTGEPRSASVDIQEAGSLLRISKQAFDQFVSEIPGFSLMLSRILSDRLRTGTFNLLEASANQKAYQRFISQQDSRFEAKLHGTCKSIKRLKDKINQIAKNDETVLIIGEAGTEKGDVARLIHSISKKKNEPFLSVDIKSVNMGRSDGGHKHHDPIRLELAQECALFGHVKDAFSFASERRLGLFQVGDGGTIVIENIEHLAFNIQTRLADFIENGHFQTLGSQNTTHSTIRIIATSCVDLSEHVQNNKFNKHLFDLFKESQTLIVPPLKKRKKDLGQIVKYLVKLYSTRAGKSVPDINDDAYKDIMSYDWPGNTDELKAVIQRAVNLTSSTILTSEDILIGISSQITGGAKFNLLKFKHIRSLFLSRFFPNTIQFVTASFFALIICLGFFGSQEPGNNISLELTWGIWEPLAIMLSILAAKIWCAACPVGALSSHISHNYGLKRNIPSFIRSHGDYFAVAGLGLIFLSIAFFNMPASPRATAAMILSIFAPAIILAFIYRRRIWCRFLCPLGKLLGFLSRCSPLELRANYNICNNDCTDHACYIGSDRHPGCPVFEAPFVLYNNQECILCGNCIKNCPHQSPVLSVRAPGQELWTFRKPDSVMILLASLITGSQFFRGLEKTDSFHSYMEKLDHQWMIYSIFITLTCLLAFLLIQTAGNMIFKSVKTTSREKSNLMVYLLVPIIASFELGFQFERLVSLGGQSLVTLGNHFNFDWSFLMISMGPGMIKFHQIAFMLAGLLYSRVVLVKLLNNQHYLPINHLSRLGHWPVILLAVSYILIF